MGQVESSGVGDVVEVVAVEVEQAAHGQFDLLRLLSFVFKLLHFLVTRCCKVS